MSKKILVIGSLNMDLVTEARELPAPGETVLGRSLSYIPGGKGANQAVAAAKLGARVSMLGRVGADDFAARLIDNLRGAGVNTENIKGCAGVNTGAALICVDARGENSIVVIAGANEKCDEAFLKENSALFENYDYIMLQLEIPLGAVGYAINKTAGLGKTIVLNHAPMTVELDEELLAKVSYLTPNENELARLYKRLFPADGRRLAGDNVEMARVLAERLGIKIAVTLGAAGAVLTDGKNSTHFKGRQVDVVDTTAAGDCFNAAFVAALASGKTEPEAMGFANAAAAIAVTRKGAQTSLPSLAEVDFTYRNT
ncbi:MAG: ribokinase [Peptococcaceae bacterium]|jgi:ribokinase|nr:ribokinase [Peptococcaceae bacterium]